MSGSSMGSSGQQSPASGRKSMKGEHAFPNPLEQVANGPVGSRDTFDSETGSHSPRIGAAAAKGAMVARQFGTDALSNVNAMFATTFFTKADGDTLTEENYKIMWFGLLHPHAPLRRVYLLFHALILLYIVYVLPKRIGFGLKPSPTTVEVDATIDVLILIDIILNFRAYYFDKRNILVVHATKIRSNYLTTWFVVDFLAIVPADQVVLIVAASLDSDALKSWVPLIRFTRLLRITRLANLGSMLQTRRLKKNVVHVLEPLGFTMPLLDFVFTVVFLIGFLLTACHVFGCWWAYVGLHERIQNKGWTMAFYEDDLPPVEIIYTDVVYFALVTMTSVGYGDMLSKTNAERSLNILMIITGGFVYAFIVGSFGQMVDQMNHDVAQFDKKMRSVSALLKFYKTPWEMEERVLAFYAHKYNTHTLFPDDEEFLSELPSVLHDELVLHRFETAIQKVPFLVGVREDVVVALCSRFKIQPIMPGDPVMTEGTMYRRELLIVARGVVNTLHDGFESEHNVGAFFGELEFLGVSDRRSVTVMARVYVETASLHPNDIDDVLERHPFIRQRLQRYAVLRQEIEMKITEGSASIEEIQEHLSKSAKEVQSMNEPFQASDDVKERMLQKIWARADRNRNGTLDKYEVLDVLLQMGMAKNQIASTDGTLQWEGYDGKTTCFSDLDKDGSGEVDLDEFRKWYFEQDIGDPLHDEAAYQDRAHVSTTARLEHIEQRLKDMEPTMLELKDALPKISQMADKILGPVL